MTHEIKQIAVAGAGVMGTAIAQYFAQQGLDVLVYDVIPASLERIDTAVAESQQLLIRRGVLTQEQAEAARGRIRTSSDMNDFSRADLVIEAIIENMAIKQDFFRQLETICRPDTIFATNTSSLSVNEICRKMTTKARFIGANWWTPAHIIPLIEMVRADETSGETTRRLYDFFESVGKKPIVISREVKGFVGNRIQFAVMREAMDIVENGYASMKDVDRVLHYGLGLRYACLGPFEIADLGGLDTFYKIASYLFADLSDTGEVHALLADHYNNGEFGVKSGKGYYEYADGRDKEMIAYRDKMFLKVSDCLYGDLNQ